MAIQDQISLQRPYKVSDAYQLALKVEAQLARNTPRKLVIGRTNGDSNNKLGMSAKGKGIAATMHSNQPNNYNSGKTSPVQPNN